MKTDPKIAAGRAFVRSLNILLKFARLYGYDHARTGEQVGVAWNELRAAIPEGSSAGLLLGATGAQLLLDGAPLEGTPAEKQFAQLLSAAGLASIQFTSEVTKHDLIAFARAFPTGKAKPSELAEQLKAAIAGSNGIRVNEICFVATDSRLKETSAAAQIAAASLGKEQDRFKELLNDPQKLLELIAAAQGSHTADTANAPGERLTSASETDVVEGSGSAPVFGEPADSAGTGSQSRPGMSTGFDPAGFGVSRQNSGTSGRPGRGDRPAPNLGDQEIYPILRALTTLAKIGVEQNPAAAAVEFQDHVTQLPRRAQSTLRDALAGIAQRKHKKLDQSVLVQLAEHLSIRFALDQFERGEVHVNAVRQMLDRMNQEIENLRKILLEHENKMADAGLPVESHREILDRQFWAAVPEKVKREVLLSAEAWCIPAKNVHSYVAKLIEQGNAAEGISILRNYAACAGSEESDARRRAVTGLSELAELYAEADPGLLRQALREVGIRLSVEQDPELQQLTSAAFVRLTQEAATRHCFPAMEQALDLLEAVEAQRPGVAKSLRLKMGIEERIPEFVEEALRARELSAGLTGVLKQLPQAAMEQLATRFNRCQLREDLENVTNLAHELGEEALQYLRSTVRGGAVAEAVEMVGLLTKLDPQSAEAFLPGRINEFPRIAQDRIVRHISATGSPERSRVLLAILDHVDPLVMPLVIDEIGISGDPEALNRLLAIAEGDLPNTSAPYVQVKAIEALGRLNASEAMGTLKRIVEARRVFGWTHPRELRIAAFQILGKWDPAWAQEFAPKSGIEPDELALAPLPVAADSRFVRQRRYARFRLRRNITAVSTNLKNNCRLEIKSASLNGGLAATNMHLAPGTQVHLRMQVGLRNLQATAMMRDYRAQDMSFEIVDMGLEERSKFRKLLLESAA